MTTATTTSVASRRAVPRMASGREQPDRVVGPPEGDRRDGPGLLGPMAQQAGQLGAIVEQGPDALLHRPQRLDDGFAGVGLQRPVLGVLAGEDLRVVAGAR